MKRGDFSGIRNRIYDPLTGQPFPGNIIPTSRLSPQALYFNQLHPRSQHELRDLRLVGGPQAERRPVHGAGRPHPFREAQGVRPLQLPRQPHGRSQLEPGRAVPRVPGHRQRTPPYPRPEHRRRRDEHLQPDRPQRVPLQLPAADRRPRAVRPGHELPAGGGHHGLRGDRPSGGRGLLPGFHLERLQQHERVGLRPASQDPGPEGAGVDGQPHAHAGPPHPQRRRQDPPLDATLHRQQAVPGRMGVQRLRDPEPGEPRGHRRCLRRLHAGDAATGHPVVPRRHLRRTGDLLPLLCPGRHQGEQPAEPQRRPAVRDLAVGLRLSRPGRHLRSLLLAADHRGERDRPDRPRGAVRRALRLRALPELHPDEQPGGAAPLDHRHRLDAVRSPLRLRLGPHGQDGRCAAGTASSSSRRTPTGA